MYTYLENIKIIKEFYNSDFIFDKGKMEFKEKNAIYLKGIIETLYRDPDVCDSLILENAKKISDTEGMIFKADGICGWKNLFDVYDGQKSESWLDKYKSIRGSRYGELFWPGILDKEKHQTINQQRYRCFGDRIDWTLFDIKQYCNKEKTKMSYENKYTKAYFEKFGSESDKFKNFIDEMKLQIFVNPKYDVFDLSKDNGNLISEKSEYAWSTNYGIKRKKEWLEKYIKNLVEICDVNPKLV
jgi:hypothetical protein